MNRESLYLNNYQIVITWSSEDLKAYVSYFINEKEIQDWNSIPVKYQTLITSLVNGYCEYYELTKWSY